MSLSPSPAFFPCGIPFELELPALEPVELAAGAAEELEDFDVDEPPPQPATAIAATAISRAIQRRAVAELMVMVLPLIPLWTARARESFPGKPGALQSAIPSPQPPSITISWPVM